MLLYFVNTVSDYCSSSSDQAVVCYYPVVNTVTEYL